MENEVYKISKECSDEIKECLKQQDQNQRLEVVDEIKEFGVNAIKKVGLTFNENTKMIEVGIFFSENVLDMFLTVASATELNKMLEKTISEATEFILKEENEL